jgi:hypothetical protein
MPEINAIQRAVETIRQAMENEGADYGEGTIKSPGQDFKLKITLAVLPVEQEEETDA